MVKKCFGWHCAERDACTHYHTEVRYGKQLFIPTEYGEACPHFEEYKEPEKAECADDD
jgi:hypothetical protein